jgi:hypothetical protein
LALSLLGAVLGSTLNWFILVANKLWDRWLKRNWCSTHHL